MMVELAELQRKIFAASHSYTEQFGIDRSGDWAALKFAEEAGEFMQAYLRATGRSRHSAMAPDAARTDMANELADVIGMALILAEENGLELLPAFERKWHISLKEKV